jgi:hypothetical protein
MAITYLYADGLNKPIKAVYVDNLSKVANVSTSTDYNKYSYTDGTTIYFYAYSNETPAVGDHIIIMQDQDNYLMKAPGYSNTYFQVA